MAEDKEDDLEKQQEERASFDLDDLFNVDVDELMDKETMELEPDPSEIAETSGF